jgi:hypothetical protein
MVQNMLRKLVQAAAVIALLAAPAAAQFMPSLPLGGTDKPPPTPEEVEKQKALDNAYKSATSKIPDKKQQATDPWGNIRQSPPPKNKPQ